MIHAAKLFVIVSKLLIYNHRRHQIWNSQKPCYHTSTNLNNFLSKNDTTPPRYEEPIQNTCENET